MRCIKIPSFIQDHGWTDLSEKWASKSSLDGPKSPPWLGLRLEKGAKRYGRPCSAVVNIWNKSLNKVWFFSSQNVHDESLPTSIQTMSCKLLLNLVECIKARSEKETCVNKGRELLMRMNEVFVLKFKTVAKMQLPVLMAKHKQAFQQVKLKSE